MAASPRPLSFWVLERYALGELSGAELQRVREQLAGDPVSAGRLSEITAAAALPPLDLGGPSAPTGRGTLHRLRFAIPALAAAAAALLLTVGRQDVGRQDVGRGGDPVSGTDHAGTGSITAGPVPPARREVKGGEVAVLAVGEKHGEGATRFDLGERLMLRVTCPPGLSQHLHVGVFQGDRTDAPLAPFDGARCGNLAVWPGAFTLDAAEPATVCVAWGSDAAEPARAASRGEVVCVRLWPTTP